MCGEAGRGNRCWRRSPLEMHLEAGREVVDVAQCVSTLGGNKQTGPGADIGWVLLLGCRLGRLARCCAAGEHVQRLLKYSMSFARWCQCSTAKPVVMQSGSQTESKQANQGWSCTASGWESAALPATTPSDSAPSAQPPVASPAVCQVACRRTSCGLRWPAVGSRRC